jgi:hypothetical protein
MTDRVDLRYVVETTFGMTPKNLSIPDVRNFKAARAEVSHEVIASIRCEVCSKGRVHLRRQVDPESRQVWTRIHCDSCDATYTFAFEPEVES